MARAYCAFCRLQRRNNISPEFLCSARRAGTIVPAPSIFIPGLPTRNARAHHIDIKREKEGRCLITSLIRCHLRVVRERVRRRRPVSEYKRRVWKLLRLRSARRAPVIRERSPSILWWSKHLCRGTSLARIITAFSFAKKKKIVPCFRVTYAMFNHIEVIN